MQSLKPIGIILSGGPSSVYDADAPAADPRSSSSASPSSASATACSSSPTTSAAKCAPHPSASTATPRSPSKTPHQALRRPAQRDPGLDEPRRRSPRTPRRLQAHRRTSNALAAIANEDRRIWAVQFHPEVAPHPARHELIENFVFDICGARGDWTPAHFIESTVASIREQVGDRPRHLRPLRRRRLLRRRRARPQSHRRPAHLHLRQQRPPAQKRIRQACRRTLREQARPQPRRRRRQRALPRPARRRHRSRAEAQDHRQRIHRRLRRRSQRIVEPNTGEESPGSSRARSTPTSSNPSSVKGPSRRPSRATTTSAACPTNMKLKLIEPLRDLFKDEVRRIGRDLGMPEDILERQPFPGPGLAVRILGEITAGARRPPAGRRRHRRRARSKPPASTASIWQTFAVLLPVKSVGVMGDQRTYAYTCAIRAVALRRRHDRRLGPAPLRSPAHASPTASSTKSAASTASSTTSPPSPPAPSSGSKPIGSRLRISR